MQIGCCTSVENLELIRRLGYHFIDLPGVYLTGISDLEFVRLKDKLAFAKIPCKGVHASVPASVKIIGGDFDEDAASSYLKKLIQRVKELGVEFVGIGSPASRCIPEGFDRRRADEQMLHFLAAACRLAGDDACVLLESLNRSETNYINTVCEAETLIDRLDYKNKGLVLDIYHFLVEKEDPMVISSGLAAKIKYLHVADPEDRSFPRTDRMEIYERIVKRVICSGYNGAVSIEAIPRNMQTDAEEGIKALRKLLNN